MKTKIILGLLVACVTSFGATPQEFSKGVDFTGQSSVTAILLNQLVDAAKPAANRGLVIVSATTPDTVNYPYYTNYIWKDISVSPPALRFYNNGVWSSATVGANTVDTGAIINGAVTTAKIADYNITSAKIGTNAVQTFHLADLSVVNAKIADSAVNASKLADNSVTTTKIVDGNVTTAKLNDGAVTTDKLYGESVTGAKIAKNTIDNTHLKANSVTSTNIAENTIGQEHLKADSVTTSNIINGSVTLNKIGFPTLKIYAYIFFTRSGNSITAIDKYNVSTMTKNGVGDYSITFSNAVPSVNYFIQIPVGAIDSNSTYGYGAAPVMSSTKQNTNFRFTMTYVSNPSTLLDFSDVSARPQDVNYVIVYGP